MTHLGLLGWAARQGGNPKRVKNIELACGCVVYGTPPIVLRIEPCKRHRFGKVVRRT